MDSMTHLDDIIAVSMLTALTHGDSPTPLPAKSNVSVEEQKRFLCRNVDYLSTADKKNFGNVLVMHGLKPSLQFCNVGTAINLDVLSDTIIAKLYDLVSYAVGEKK